MTEENTTLSTTDKKGKLVLMTIILLGGLTLLTLGGAGVFAIVQQKPEWLGIKNEAPKTEEEAKAEVEQVVLEVGKIIELPADEMPTLATVTDLEKVKSQPFFTKAQNGDKVLVYANSRKAILYRPSEKKVIEVGVVNIPSPTSQVVVPTAIPPIVTLTITPTQRPIATPIITTATPVAPTNTP